MSLSNGNKRLTGKQAAFVDKYLGEARFNATLAAKLAGYRSTSQHSFESIGSENLTRPQIRKTIDEYFKMSRMSAEECLVELSTLARGDSKDKVRALALLSSHFGLLDGSGKHSQVALADKEAAIQESRFNLQVASQVERALQQAYGEMAGDVDLHNKKVKKQNERGLAAFQAIIKRYSHSAMAVEALTLLREIINERATLPELAEFETDDDETEDQPIEQTEVEIIPPARRLQPAAVERMMRESDPEPEEFIDVEWMGQRIRVPRDHGVY